MNTWANAVMIYTSPRNDTQTDGGKMVTVLQTCPCITIWKCVRMLQARSSLIRKYLINFLHYLFPRTFIPLYSMVAFTRIPIHEVMRRNERQNSLINRGFCFVLVAGLIGVGFCVWRRIRVPFKIAIYIGRKYVQLTD